jgi:hypothetical protein
MISATTTRKGLKIKAVLDSKQYETGVKITDDQMSKLKIKYHKKMHNGTTQFHPLDH